MKVLNCNIKSGKVKFNGVVNLEIESSINTLTDTCKIVLPRKAIWKSDKKVKVGSGENPIFKKGDKVEVEIGYGSNLVKAFEGYIFKVTAGVPIEIHCQDTMYLLKLSTLKVGSYPQVDLKTLLTDNLPPDINFKAVDVNLGAYRPKGHTIAQVLNELKSDYGLYSYFRDGILYSGLAYWEDYRQIHKFKFGINILRDDLEFINEDDLKIKIKAISHLQNNEVIKIEVGDEYGDLRTLHFYGLSKKDLELIANEKLTSLKYSGFVGSFTAFGEPFVKPGDAVQIINDNWKEKSGTYLVDSVKYSFGKKGYKQKISIKQKIN